MSFLQAAVCEGGATIDVPDKLTPDFHSFQLAACSDVKLGKKVATF